IAEGVESANHGVLLMRLGCDIAQGFGIAYPMPAAEILSWVKQYQPDPKWQLWGNLKWALHDLPLLVAQNDHHAWIKNVETAVEHGYLPFGNMHPIDHRHCNFGHWYGAHGRENYGHLPEFAAIEAVHKQVHEIGAQIMQLRDAGDLHQARLKCAELAAAKHKINVMLDGLQQAVIREHNNPMHAHIGHA
ncbi:MAG TPA: CZB domain-containing protein, partial [Gammaproteobacteria bacterium]|nr:CZB domain-containing protein [Gammaproteobacteria bacterium]